MSEIVTESAILPKETADLLAEIKQLRKENSELKEILETSYRYEDMEEFSLRISTLEEENIKLKKEINELKRK